MANNEPLSKSEITHYTNMWCRSKGISAKDLESHLQADDLVLLINIREATWHMLNQQEQGVWAAYWGWTYTKKFSLKKKHIKKLEIITFQALSRYNQIEQARQKIKVRRLTTISKTTSS
jgi:hypothetical protein